MQDFSDRARKVLTILADQEARRFGHEWIGTEHILLGLIKEGSGVAANIFHNLLEINLRVMQGKVEKFITEPGVDVVPYGKLPHTPRARKAIEFAMSEASNAASQHVCTEHLLLGILLTGENVAFDALTSLGITIEKVRQEISSLTSKTKNQAPEECNLEDLQPSLDKLKEALGDSTLTNAHAVDVVVKYIYRMRRTFLPN